MSDASDQGHGGFAKIIEERIPPRDHQGKFIAETSKPELMFAERGFEGTPDDGGDDPQLVQREKEVREEKKPVKAKQDVQPAVDEDHPPDDLEAREKELEASEEPEGDAEKYEIEVEGERRQVTLKEALAGYMRQETFSKYVQQLQEFKTKLESNQAILQANWQMWDKARSEFEEDVANMLPKEPDWDHEYALDARAAHEKQKNFNAIHTRLAQSRTQRAERQQLEAKERDRQIQDYAVNGFAKFVADQEIPDDKLQRELQSMRRTAASVGFSEHEIATTYDPRMLVILRKASIYDRWMANRPKAIVPGKGKTLTPGSAPAIGSNQRRNGLEEAQRQLARSGRLDDAALVFDRILQTRG